MPRCTTTLHYPSHGQITVRLRHVLFIAFMPVFLLCLRSCCSTLLDVNNDIEQSLCAPTRVLSKIIHGSVHIPLGDDFVLISVFTQVQTALA